MTAAYTLFAGLFGAATGSFLNVVAHRLPRAQSLLRPNSRCPSCETPIKPYDNVPVLSWLWLRGHCRSCNASISGRYPLIEALTALLYVGVVLHAGANSHVWLGLVLVTLLVPVAAIDLETRLIPNRLLLPAAVAALALTVAFEPGELTERLISAGAAGGFFLAAALAHPRGMGMGDVKLAAVLGLFLGSAVGPAVLVALVTGTLAGVAVMARAGTGRKTAIPFGPFLALGGLVALFAGHELVQAYLNHFT